jgi:hypothetical protein
MRNRIAFLLVTVAALGVSFAPVGDTVVALPDDLCPEDVDTSSVLNERPVHAPEDAVISSIVASDEGWGPGAPRSGVVYAAGEGTQDALRHRPRLFRSSDGGASWDLLPACRFSGAEVLLPPAYPEDPVLYGAGLTGLQVSHDHGVTFDDVVTTASMAVATMSPGFSEGDRRILLGSTPTWEFDAGLGVATPFAVVPPRSHAYSSFGFDPDYADNGRFFAGGNGLVVDPDSTDPLGAVRETTFATCHGKLCGDVVTFPNLTGPPQFHVSSRLAEDGVILLWHANWTNSLHRSDDAGRTFEHLPVTSRGVLSGVDEDERGTMYAGLHSIDPGRGGVLRSRDRGRSWELLGQGTPLVEGVNAVAAMSDGRLLAAASWRVGGGVWCSVNAGQTWARRCPPSA